MKKTQSGHQRTKLGRRPTAALPHVSGVYKQFLASALANIAASCVARVGQKLADGTGEEVGAKNKEKPR